MTLTKAATALALAFSFALTAHAQSTETTPKTTDCSKMPNRASVQDCAREHAQIKIIRLTNVTSQNQANEILVALRNTFDPSDRMFLVAERRAIVVNTYPEEFARMEALVHELDTPHKTYRLTYTLTDIDSGKHTGTHRYSIVLIPGHTAVLKEGSKVPVATGSYKPDAAATTGSQTQFTYLDVGMSLESTLFAAEQGAYLSYKVAQSNIGDTQSGVGPQDPIVHQTVISGDSVLVPNKPTLIGSIDVLGSNHRTDIEAELEPIQ